MRTAETAETAETATPGSARKSRLLLSVVLAGLVLLALLAAIWCGWQLRRVQAHNSANAAALLHVDEPRIVIRRLNEPTVTWHGARAERLLVLIQTQVRPAGLSLPMIRLHLGLDGALPGITWRHESGSFHVEARCEMSLSIDTNNVGFDLSLMQSTRQALLQNGERVAIVDLELAQLQHLIRRADRVVAAPP